MSSSGKRLCTFLVDDLLLGLDVLHVQEVIREQEMTPVPLAPSVVRGLINLRGQIVTAIDLRQRLGLPPRTSTLAPTNVVTRHGEGVVSLLVDEIGDVVDVDDASFEPPPATLRSESKALVRGVYKLERQLLLLLDTELVVRIDAHTTREEQPHVH